MKRAIIMGAAGRDYYNFLSYFKGNKNYRIVAFTQSQIPGIAKRKFPKKLAGKAYSKSIPFYPEQKLPVLVKKYNVDEVFLCYSDLSHDEVMQKASLVLSTGASFGLLGPKETMLQSKKPVIAVCGVRTGVGKSPLSIKIMEILKKKKCKIAAVRHPMPYGNLSKDLVQKYEKLSDFKKYNATIEEQEEYYNYVKRGFVIYAGVDYSAILKKIEHNIKKYKPHTKVLKTSSLVSLNANENLAGKRALIIGDGPTLTHGGMSFGAGTVAAKKYKITIIDAKKYAVGSFKNTFQKFSHIQKELPALGYSKKQVEELRQTIIKSKCDVVLNASPSPLREILKLNVPIVDVTYKVDDRSARIIEKILMKFLKKY